MADVSHEPGRPVYVLGAGFSRAISDSMPVTNALGQRLRERLEGRLEIPPEAGNDFEQWLSLLITPMPFLARHANTARRAQVELVIAELADELDSCAKAATDERLPLWLEQLVCIWHAERAVILTFNYDTLLERAVTSSTVCASHLSGHARHFRGTDVVFPAPVLVDAHTWGDQPSPVSDSMQILKLHGSLNWFLASGSDTASSAVRTPDGREFGTEEGLRSAAPDTSGATKLDRLVVPPVSAKDGYYGVQVVQAIWRTAADALQRASSVTLVGYSMPHADRIATELLREAPKDVMVDLVDREVGHPSDPETLAHRVASLGCGMGDAWSGDDAVARYASERVTRASVGLDDHGALRLGARDSENVVVFTGASSGESGSGFTLARTASGAVVAADLPWTSPDNLNLPPIELSLGLQVPGRYEPSDFLTRGGLRGALDAEGALRFSMRGREHVIISLSETTLGSYGILRAEAAPVGEVESS